VYGLHLVLWHSSSSILTTCWLSLLPLFSIVQTQLVIPNVRKVTVYSANFSFSQMMSAHSLHFSGECYVCFQGERWFNNGSWAADLGILIFLSVCGVPIVQMLKRRPNQASKQSPQACSRVHSGWESLCQEASVYKQKINSKKIVYLSILNSDYVSAVVSMDTRQLQAQFEKILRAAICGIYLHNSELH